MWSHYSDGVLFSGTVSSGVERKHAFSEAHSVESAGGKVL